jgi:hypothetical protein
MPFPRGSRSRLRRSSLLALVAAATIPLGCGSDSGGRLLSQKQAGELRGTLSAVEQDVAAKDCTSAADEVSTLQSEIDGIRRLDRDLRSALRASVRRLETLVEDKCQTAPSQTQTQTTPTTPQEGTTGTTGATGPGGPKDKKPKKEKPPKTPPGQGEQGPSDKKGEGGGAGVPGESNTDAGGG